MLSELRSAKRLYKLQGRNPKVQTGVRHAGNQCHPCDSRQLEVLDALAVWIESKNITFLETQYATTA
jgi:hypothetical protein